MTELELLEVITDRMGRRPVDKIEALYKLRKLIAHEPNWMVCLPESLLDKLGIKYNHQFDDKEIALAAVIGARCERRLA